MEVVEELRRKQSTLNYFDESLKLQGMINDFFAKLALNHSDELPTKKGNLLIMRVL